MRLDGRHALVTGGLGTIGRALALAYRDAGADVTLLDRPDLSISEGVGWLGLDLNDLAGTQAAVAAAGPFDILVISAALIVN